MDINGIIEAFKADPVGLTDYLKQKQMLKGQISKALSDHVMKHARDTKMADVLWLPLTPRTLSVVCVDNWCNLACRMCGGSKGPLKYLSADGLEKMLDNCPTAELIIFVADNSEPLANPDMPKLLKIVSERRLNSNIVTNGHLLSDSLIDVMLENSQPTILNISLDAVSQDAYRNIRGADVEKVKERLMRFRDRKRELKKESPRLSLLMVGMGDNIAELNDMVLYAAELDAWRVHVDHLNGKHHPGDFTENPSWRRYLMEASDTAESMKMELHLPCDALAQSHKKPAVTDSLSDQAQAVSTANIQTTTANQASSRPLEILRCPAIESVHIGLDGNMRACCNVPTSVGNIYDSSLEKNTDFLKVKLEYYAGRIHRACMGVANCPYVMDIKTKKALIDFVD